MDNSQSLNPTGTTNIFGDTISSEAITNSMPNLPPANTAYATKTSTGYQGPFPVEKVMKKRVTGGKIEYLLKWLGYPESEASWEPYESIHCESLIKELERELKMKQDSKTAIGFERCLEPEEIIGGTESGGRVKFLMKWKGVNQLEMVPCEDAVDYCPDLVLNFFQKRVSCSFN